MKIPSQLTDFSLDGWKSSMGLTSDKLTTFATDQLMEYLGIAGYLKKTQCSVQNGNSTIQGWNDGTALLVKKDTIRCLTDFRCILFYTILYKCSYYIYFHYCLNIKLIIYDEI